MSCDRVTFLHDMELDQVLQAEGERWNRKRRAKAWSALHGALARAEMKKDEAGAQWRYALTNHNRAIRRNLEARYWFRADRCLPLTLLQNEDWFATLNQKQWAELVLMSVGLQDCLLNRFLWSTQLDRKLFLPRCFRDLFHWEHPERYNFSCRDPTRSALNGQFPPHTRDPVSLHCFAFLIGRFDSGVQCKDKASDHVVLEFYYHPDLVFQDVCESFKRGRKLLSAEIAVLTTTLASALAPALCHPIGIITKFLVRYIILHTRPRNMSAMWIFTTVDAGHAVVVGEASPPRVVRACGHCTTGPEHSFSGSVADHTPANKLIDATRRLLRGVMKKRA